MMHSFFQRLEQQPETIQFNDTIALIDHLYDYTPVGFHNGPMYNPAGQNQGSCKVFYFAFLNQLSQQHTLMCFGDFYRFDVLQHADHSDHQNIRQFIRSGWPGIQFDLPALHARATL